MATAVAGKRKREDSSTTSIKAKRPAVNQKANGSLAKARKNVAVPQPHVDVPVRTKDSEGSPALETSSKAKVPSTEAVALAKATEGDIHLQLVTGSYERVLYGVAATIPRGLLQLTDSPSEDATKDSAVTFSDTFLFAAHASSVRCLAISPATESDKRYLATGSSDERINVYSVSTAPPTNDQRVDLPTLASSATAVNPRNRSLGSLIHHDRAITRLEFPAKGKLFSAAEDNTIAISRTRDWTVLSSIKAPIPKPQGRPSGDTAGPGEVPAGVNDFAIHPSQKLMLSVSRGERCLRLWNLMTGKKAGVLNFDRSLLTQVGESKYSSGEGRSVLWNISGEAYVVGFERGAAVFGVDSKPQALIRPTPNTKLHQFRMVPAVAGSEDGELLAVSTEDGRILFFRTSTDAVADAKEKLPLCSCVAQLGGPGAGISGRIKDFEIVDVQVEEAPALPVRLVVTASSDGAVRVWNMKEQSAGVEESEDLPKQFGSLIATLETGSRITCLGAFLLDGKAEGEPADEDDADFGAMEDAASSGGD
ncbi:Protein mak11 [Elasticomyces elasticus]|uniref:Protein mak11 n=1 Tax=Elasticomyces elasticus TaxID=574655 RepID=A0AAN7VMH7_9PEZI|nr:Protein mak11 [Elasticomyces elasticus]